MTSTRRLRVQPSSPIDEGLAQIQAELKLPTASAVAVEAAAANAAAQPRLADLDRTGIALVTIDPAESMDPDQALYVALTRRRRALRDLRRATLP